MPGFLPSQPNKAKTVKQRLTRPHVALNGLQQLLTQKLDSQEREGVVIANIINLWNSFGRPISVKNA
jgi:hypothetical protein